MSSNNKLTITPVYVDYTPKDIKALFRKHKDCNFVVVSTKSCGSLTNTNTSGYESIEDMNETLTNYQEAGIVFDSIKIYYRTMSLYLSHTEH